MSDAVAMQIVSHGDGASIDIGAFHIGVFKHSELTDNVQAAIRRAYLVGLTILSYRIEQAMSREEHSVRELETRDLRIPRDHQGKRRKRK